MIHIQISQAILKPDLFIHSTKMYLSIIEYDFFLLNLYLWKLNIFL